MLLLITSIKLVCEVALLAMIGQGALHLMAGAKREGNVMYGLLRVATGPFTRAAARCLPARCSPRVAALLAFAVLMMAWLLATVAKIHHCLGTTLPGCR